MFIKIFFNTGCIFQVPEEWKKTGHKHLNVLRLFLYKTDTWFVNIFTMSLTHQSYLSTSWQHAVGIPGLLVAHFHHFHGHLLVWRKNCFHVNTGGSRRLYWRGPVAANAKSEERIRGVQGHAPKKLIFQWCKMLQSRPFFYFFEFEIYWCSNKLMCTYVPRTKIKISK